MTRSLPIPAFVRRSTEAILALVRRATFAARWTRRMRYARTVAVEARSDAIPSLAAAGHPVIERKGDHPVWLSVQCPCRCGTRLRVNLMRSQSPVWRATVDTDGRLSVAPSLDVPTCGSHFWIRHGAVDWCRDT
jgi:hypothetical protein